MGAEIIPFDFEEQAVRVLMRGDDPWFVAADVCRVLELKNPSMAIRGLDEDEVTLSQIEGNHREVNLINESGLYALVVRSDKPEAKKFRKWITAEVLPAIRKHGRYDHQLPEPEGGGEIAGLPIREAELWLQMVREARLTRGTRAAASIWDRSPLPPLVRLNAPAADPAEGRACLGHLAAWLGGERAEAVLSPQGLRAREDGLFVANFALPVFDGTRWAGGAHRAALLALPGAFILSTPLTLAARATRGLILPWPLIEREGV